MSLFEIIDMFYADREIRNRQFDIIDVDYEDVSEAENKTNEEKEDKKHGNGL